MSNALVQLRIQFNDPILVRSGRKMVSTPLGKQLLPKLRSIMFDIKQLDNEAFNPETTNQIFTIGFFDYTEPLFLPRIMKKIGDKAFKIRFHIKSLDTLFSPELFDFEHLALGISVMTAKTKYLNFSKLFCEEAICIMREGHVLAAEPFTLEKFLQVNHLVITTTSEPIDSIIDKTLQTMDMNRNIVLATPNIFSALSIVAQTDLIASVPKSLAEAYKTTFKLSIRPLPFVVPPVVLSLIWHQRFNKDPAHLWLRELISNLHMEISNES